ncbi:hypothetical protein CO704_06740 [Cedecea neteri]|uniref:Uncharacterized protein n=1 Tax=Cedecea neteri TaxID=158822 RepID=A0A291DVH7_9ENTR|nr:hypothetical protein CO704_06740 [Cedecea neteri]
MNYTINKKVALNDNFFLNLGDRIIIAIIINFIYYRHSNLNVRLPLLIPDACIRFFFTLLYTTLIFLC